MLYNSVAINISNLQSQLNHTAHFDDLKQKNWWFEIGDLVGDFTKKLVTRMDGAPYGDLPKVSDKIKKRRLHFAGHCLRSSGQVVSDLVLWKPVHGKRGAGRPIMTYVDLLCVRTPDKHQLKSRPAWKIGVSGEPSQMSDRCRRSEWVSSFCVG